MRNKKLNTPLHSAVVHRSNDVEGDPDAEIRAIKVALWLIENGASIDALNVNSQTALHETLQAGNYEVAKHLIDRGAVSNSLDDEAQEVVDGIRAQIDTETRSSMNAGQEEPVMKLLKHPGIVRNSSFLSVFIEQIGIADAISLPRPQLVISVFDMRAKHIEHRQLVSYLPMKRTNSLWWSATWHMQTPIENLANGKSKHR